MIKEDIDAQPPPILKETSPGGDESVDRNSRSPDRFLLRYLPGRGQILNRGLSLLSIYNSMGR